MRPFCYIIFRRIKRIFMGVILKIIDVEMAGPFILQNYWKNILKFDKIGNWSILEF